MNEYSIPIVFDVAIDGSREDAMRFLADALSEAAIAGVHAEAPTGASPTRHVDAWWALEQDDKAITGDDRDGGVMVFTRSNGGTREPGRTLSIEENRHLTGYDIAGVMLGISHPRD